MTRYQRWKKLLLLGLLVFLTLTTAACISPQGYDGKTVLILSMWPASPSEVDLVEKQIAAFERKYPDIKVVREMVVSDDYHRNLQANIAAGTPADVFYLGDNEAAPYVKRKLLGPINRYIEKADIDDFHAELLKPFMDDDGNLYGLPKGFSPMIMFYNKDMFDAAGIGAFPQTLDELLLVLQKLDEAGKAGKLGKNFVVPLNVETKAAEFNVPYVAAFGGKVYDAKSNRLVFDEPEAILGWQYIMDTVTRQGHLANDAKNIGAANSTSAFGEGRIAVLLNGGWAIMGLKKIAPDMNYGLAVVPRAKNFGGLIFSTAYVMSRDTKHPREAAELIKFMTGAEAEAITVESGLEIPPRLSMMAEYKKQYPERAALVDALPYSLSAMHGPEGLRVNDTLRKYCDKLLADPSYTVLQAMQDAKAELMEECGSAYKY